MKRSIILLLTLAAVAFIFSQVAGAATEEDRILATVKSVRDAFVDKSFDKLAKTVNPKTGVVVYGVKIKYDDLKKGEKDTTARKYEFTLFGEKKRADLTLSQLFFGTKIKGWLYDFFVDLSVDNAIFVPGVWYVPKEPTKMNRAVVIWDGKSSTLTVIKGSYDSDHVILKKSGKSWYFAEYKTAT